MMNTTKENLVFALETAGNEGREIGITYSAGKGFTLTMSIIPEVIIWDDSVEICDAEDMGMGIHLMVGLDGDIKYDEDEDAYTVEMEFGDTKIFL